MKKLMAALCLCPLIALSGCGEAATGKNPADTPAVSEQPSVTVTPESTPEPSKAPEPTPAKEPENPLDSFSDEDKAVIKEKFTFKVEPKTDKKVASGDLKDGTFIVEEPATSYGHHPYIGLTIKDGQVVEVIFFQYNPKTQSYKDENYGKEYGTQFGENTFEKAQISVEASKKYPVELIETQDVEGIDAVSGATYNLQLFKMGVYDALKLAKK